MTDYRYVQVDAFADRPFTGNPAAVMPLEEWLPDETLQAIAAENNLSETAFTVPSSRNDADYDLRTRHSGTHRFVQFHVWVPPQWTVKQAHDSLERVEHALCDRFPATEIIIHLDPEGHTDRETLLSRDLTESAR